MPMKLFDKVKPTVYFKNQNQVFDVVEPAVFLNFF
jgi:hypothetical protein